MSDYLAASPMDAPAEGGYLGGAEPATGGYLGGEPSAFDQAPAPAAMPPHNPPMQGGYTQAPTPMSSFTGGGLTVQAPMLDEVRPSPSTVGGTRNDISTLLLDVEVPVEVYFGDAALTVEEFLDLGAGSVVELDHSIEAPIELRVRGKLVATGQLVTINGNFGLRITSTVEKG